VAARAYGPVWEQRGRSLLGEAALLLAALWPSGAPAAVQGAAVHRIRLRQRVRPRHISTAKTAVAVGVAVAVVAAVVATHTRSAEPTAAGFTISGGLGRVAATSDGSAWAVGCSACGTGRTLILRWNGTTWTRVPSPDPGTSCAFLGVAAVSDGSAWAVGWIGNGSSTSPTSTRTLILRWNGAAWTRTRVPSPAPDPTLPSRA
jgi:hypothetical protein